LKIGYSMKLLIAGVLLCAIMKSDAFADDNLPPAPAPVIIAQPKKPKQPPHRFFDMKNSFAITALAVSLSGDALSTQKGLSYPGIHEVNPLAQPFVQTQAGEAAYTAVGFGLLAGGMYLAHKTEHHKLERIFPFVVAGWEGFLTWHNYQQIPRSNPR
jgi:hypothetical protein